MESKEGVLKMEEELGNSFSDYFPLQSIFDWSCEGGENMPLGFMELLGVQDLKPPLFDMGQQQAPSAVVNQALNPCSTKNERFNYQPATPNSSSISSASSEAVNDEPIQVDDDQEEDQQKTKKQCVCVFGVCDGGGSRLKPKKTNQKSQREPRFAFMTKSEVDHLEDGYRWRKYGQKAVKNSSFPRSYYRCTTTSCNVKKRVERSFTDPSMVITTYEGQHTHPSPIMPRSSLAGGAGSAPYHYRQQRQPFVNTLPPLNFGHSNGSIKAGNFHHERRFCSPGSSLLKDHGLLQDVIPSHMLKEE